MGMFLKRKASWAGVIMLLIVAMVWTPAWCAENPRLIPFQGRLTDGAGESLNGVYRIIFVIYNEPTGGNALWSEIHEDVSVINGQLNVLLGSRTKLDDPDGNGNPADGIAFTSPRFLGIRVGADTNQEMVPRQQLVPSFHAVQATSSDKLMAHHENGKNVSYGINEIVPIGLISSYFGNPADLPNNWRICDGSTVNDPESPLNGVTLPDLRAKFIRGEEASDRNIIGGLVGGGADGHTHGLSAHSHTINSDGGHSHTGTTGYGGVDHTHTYSGHTGAANNPSPCVADGNKGQWNGFLSGTSHSEHYYSGTTSGSNAYLHTHSFVTSVNGAHSHGGKTGEASSTTDMSSHLPSYVALHYIIRIK